MQIRIFLFLAISLTSATGHAQQVYRCGSTFSQQPCGPDAKTVDIRSATSADSHEAIMRKLGQKIKDTVPPPDVIETSKRTCQEMVLASLKDPASAKFGAITRMGANNSYHQGKLAPVVTYNVTVNAKNSYGGYTGDKIHGCMLSLDEKTFMWTTAY